MCVFTYLIIEIRIVCDRPGSRRFRRHLEGPENNSKAPRRRVITANEHVDDGKCSRALLLRYSGCDKMTVYRSTEHCQHKTLKKKPVSPNRPKRNGRTRQIVPAALSTLSSSTRLVVIVSRGPTLAMRAIYRGGWSLSFVT